MAEKFRVLSGLPTSGPAAVPFSANGQGLHSEGLIVEFWPGSDRAWIGNFQPGLAEFDAVAQHPNGRELVVIAGGEA